MKYCFEVYLSELIIRIIRYWRDHGARNTVLHGLQIVMRDMLSNTYIVYVADLMNLDQKKQGNFEVCKRESKDEISSEEYQQLYRFRDSRVMSRAIMKRFENMSHLWIAKRDGMITAFVWSIYGKATFPYFLKLSSEDVYLFDNEVLKDCRGHGINTIFINNVLLELKKNHFARAFIDTKIWNHAEIKSLGKTEFKKFGTGKKQTIMGLGKVSFKKAESY